MYVHTESSCVQNKAEANKQIYMLLISDCHVFDQRNLFS
jgi:hypothetical protein